MDLSAGQQKALFAVVVVILAGLGIYLIAPHGSKQPAPGRSPSASPSSPAQAAGSPSAAPVPTGAASGSGVNIFQWLPFTEPELARASTVTTQVATDYNTFTYTDSAASYVARMNGLITSQLSQTLRNGFSTLGVAQARTSQKQVSAGTATINSIRTFGSASITFVVSTTQKLTGTQGSRTSSAQYAVTVTGQGNSWQVYDIEPAGVGNT
jgi:hypothetical protein